jgi:hypothetical protein
MMKGCIAMPDRIICTIGQNIVVFEDGQRHEISSGFINQYCENHDKIMRKNSWKSDGFSARFRMELPTPHQEPARKIYENARITGIASAKKDEVIFSVTVGDSSGLFKCYLDDYDDDTEGHIMHDRGIRFLDITLSSDGRMAFSVFKDGEQNIAVAPIGTPHYQEVTGGGSIDRNPFWDSRNPDILLFDSAPVDFTNEGARVIFPKTVMKADLKKSIIEVVIEDEKHDYMNPQMDAEGNIWCIRRPHTIARQSTSLQDVLMIPYKLGRAIFGAIQMFTVRNTGEPLITSGPNPTKLSATPKDSFFEGNMINAERNMRLNQKSGDSFPGYIPQSWELIRIDVDKQIAVQAKSVCAFSLINSKKFVYSNGKYLFKSEDGNVSKVAEAVLPTKILIA